jgi:hypothetical protein
MELKEFFVLIASLLSKLALTSGVIYIILKIMYYIIKLLKL